MHATTPARAPLPLLPHAGPVSLGIPLSLAAIVRTRVHL